MILPLRHLLLLCLIWPCLAQADVLSLTSQNQGTNGFMEHLDDPQGVLNARQAMQSSHWTPLPGTLNAGFTRDVIWLRLQVMTRQGAPANWMLTLNNALLDEATLYDFMPDGSIRTLTSGEELDRSLWPVNYRSATFALTLEPEQPRWLLLRLKTKNAMAVSARLVPAEAFSERARSEYLGFGLYFGIYLALIVFHTLFWRMTDAPESGWYLIYVSCCFLIESLSSGLVQQATGIPVSLSDRILGCGLAASLPIGFIFAQRQLQITEFARFRHLIRRACLLVSALAAGAILAGHYQIGAPLVQGSSLLTILFLVGMALVLLARGRKSARFFLLVFGIYYAGVIISYLRNLGLVPTSFFTDNAITIGTLLHMLLMSLRIIQHYRQLEKEKRRAQADFKQLLQDHNVSLERQIAERTLELREEIRRRTLLEGELREALHLEQQIREEQRDFVAMVSHEFRTPLAIISTSAQQISRNLSAPSERNEQRCQNIRDASSRLLGLVDNYLDHDRVECTTTIQRNTECAVANLLADLPPERVEIRNQSARQTIVGDNGLIKIALRNLIANADRHAPADSAIQLELSDRPGFLDIRVSNLGPAIPPEQSSLLFQRYFRGTQARSSPGAGLGLHLVKRIAELHGGEVCLESRGADAPIRFRLSLPIG